MDVNAGEPGEEERNDAKGHGRKDKIKDLMARASIVSP